MRKLSFILAMFLFITPLLFACAGKKDDNSNGVIDLTEGFDEYYKARQLVCWQDIAAVYLARKTLSDYEYANALEVPKTLTEKAGFIISVSLLSRQKNDVSNYIIDDYIAEIKLSVEDGFETLTVKEMALCFFALTAARTEYNYKNAAEHLERSQNIDGGFPFSADYTYSDVESSAYALNIITLSKRYITDNCLDNTLEYLAAAINDDNTLSDMENKKSSVATALTLSSLISANLPLTGEVSTALTAAINSKFKESDGNRLIGYRRYIGDDKLKREVTGEVMLCFATTAYGNLWVSLFEEKNA